MRKPPVPQPMMRNLSRGWTGAVAITLVCASVLLLGGCATNSASTLIQASRTVKQPPPQLPSAAVVKDELAGRAFQLGRVYADLKDDDPARRLHVSSASLAAAFAAPLRQGFDAAKLGSGKTPPYTLDYAIEDVRLKQGVTLMPSIFLVRMEIVRPDGSRVLSAEFQSRYLQTIPVIFPGIVGALPSYNSALVAVSRMLPATAVVATRTAAGLQQGRPLDSIAVYPDAMSAGGVISPPDIFLKDNPYGIRPLTAAELADIARQLRAQ
jgi:hypothetical protein